MPPHFSRAAATIRPCDDTMILNHAAYCILIFLLAVTAPAQSKRRLELGDMFAIKRISSPAVSPDGRWVAYNITTPNLGANRNFTDIWISPLAGGPARQLTTDAAFDGNAAWSPDGRWIAFISTRSGTSQVWLMSLDGGEPRQFTTLSTGAAQPVWAPDGKSIAFVSDVFPEYSDRPFNESDELNKKKADELVNGKVKAKVITQLLYRHWDSWVDGKRKHIFIQSLTGGNPRDLTPGARDAVPTSSTFSGGIDYAFSPEGKEIAYTATPVPTREEAWSTNHDVYIIALTGGAPRPVTTNPAADGCPRYSPDGKYIAYRAQKRAGCEADRWELMLYDRTTGISRSLTADVDSHVGPFVWSPDSKRIYFEAEEKATVPVYVVSLKGGDTHAVFNKNSNHDVAITRDGHRLVFTHLSAVRPTEIWRSNTDGTDAAPVTTANDVLFVGLDVPAPESTWFKGHGDTPIQAWIYKPPAFDPAKKYPLVYLVHGGPQGAWLDSWSYRWNPLLWAAQGYVIMAPNPRGSTGFGQKFTDEISGDWGGKVFEDLMKGLDYAESLPYVDRTRKAAAGASFGGYMMNWFLGNAPDRFNAIVSHDGVYNFESNYGATDEVWFDEWDHGGAPWEKPEEYVKYSPHRYARNFRTPTLVIHGALDFRIPETEAMQLFTALQKRGVPSKFLYFPDEGHWVLKPANSELWHTTVFSWLAQYLRQ